MPLSDLVSSPVDTGTADTGYQAPRKVYIYGDPPVMTDTGDDSASNDNGALSGVADRIKNRLFGLNGVERYQTWPERMVRSGATMAGDVLSGKLDPRLEETYSDMEPEKSDTLIGKALGLNKVNMSAHNAEVIGRTLDMAGLVGTGGLAGTGDAALTSQMLKPSSDVTLGAGPFLRPALKFNDRIYKAPVNGQHLDALPPEMANEFQKAAMNGDDISQYNFGFMNHKGQFLSREAALDYALKEGLLNPNSEAARAGTLTSTMDLMADSSKPGAAVAANKPFYSTLEKTIADTGQAKMTGDQWLGTLANKAGVKPEEMDWTGLKDFLASKGKETVTKDELQQHLGNNAVDIKDVVKGTGDLKKAAEDLQSAAGGPTLVKGQKLYPDEIEQGLWDGSLTPKDLPTNLQPHAEKLMSLRYQQEQPTKYHSYQLPGGENYKETLLTLPDKRTARQQYLETKASKERLSGDELKEFQSYNKDQGQYKSSHWDEPNVLAHIRTNERDVAGKPSLHIEEIQSDWHQAGRKQGYADSANPYEVFDPVTASIKGKYATEAEAKKAVEGTKLDYSKSQGVPDAPFKTSWPELAMKKSIRQAIENGQDRVSWTPGEAQAARYDLSKTFNDIHANKLPDGTYNIGGTRNGSFEQLQSKVPENKLPEIVGKELADKISKQTIDKNQIYKGADLKVGGEGMKGFYDNMLPKMVEKLGKKYGVKVKQGEFPGKLSNRMGQPPEMHKVHYFDIPEQMKQDVLTKGFPLFSKGVPIPHTEDTRDPHADLIQQTLDNMKAK